MASISEMRNAMRSGVQRQHKWRVIFDFPAEAATGDVALQASLLARSGSAPSSTLGQMIVPFEGRQIKLPGDRTYEDFTATFMGVNDYRVRDAFERWSEIINGSESNTGLVLFDDYMRDVTFQLLDQSDNVIKEYIFKDAWPMIVGQQDMDRGSTDSWAEFPVTLAYQSVESNTTR